MGETESARAAAETVPFVALDRQHAALQEELEAVFVRMLRSSAFTLGAEVEAFEQAFAAACGAAHCVGVSSGTSALELMLRAHGIGTGDEVIVPAHTFIASALAVAHVGATPVLCDVRPDTGLIDPEALRAAVGPRTAAVLVVHLYGQACEMDAVRAVAGPAALLVVEDAAQAAGARWAGRPVGTLGTSAAFSFYPGKNLGALGDGGAVCTGDALVAARVRRLRNLGQRGKGEHVEIGYNARLDGLQAALLSVKLPHLDDWNDARRVRAARYRALLADRVALVAERPATPSIHHVFAARFPDRDRVARILSAAGVHTGVHYARAVHQHPAWAGRGLRHGELPVAEAWAAEELSLPMHPDLTEAEIERVVYAVDAALA